MRRKRVQAAGVAAVLSVLVLWVAFGYGAWAVLDSLGVFGSVQCNV